MQGYAQGCSNDVTICAEYLSIRRRFWPKASQRGRRTEAGDRHILALGPEFQTRSAARLGDHQEAVVAEWFRSQVGSVLPAEFRVMTRSVAAYRR